jgi:hypothetical protein
MKPPIEIPQALRERINADQSRLQKHRAGEADAQNALQSEMRALENTQATLVQRSATLAIQAVESDLAAQELGNVERRAAAIRARLDQLRAKPLPAIDLGETFGVLFALCYFWEDAVKSIVAKDCQKYDLDLNAMRIFLGQLPALHTLRNIVNWLATTPPPNHHTLARVFLIYERALKGEFDLSRDAIQDATPSLPKT